jgi:AraC-like DNA-binding protein
MRAMISVAAMTGLLECITAAGRDPDPILRAVGLDRSVLGNPEGFVASSVFTQLLEEASRQTGDDCFGLHFGNRFNPKNIGPLAYVVINSPTILAGIENAARYLKVHNQAAATSLDTEGQWFYLRYRVSDSSVDSVRQHNEYSMAVVLNTVRLMAGSDWRPQEVQFAHQSPAQITEHGMIFGVPVLFGRASNALVVEHEFIQRQVPAADSRLCQILQRYLEHVLADMPREDDVVASVRKAMAETMREGDPTIARVAKKMGLSPRTLERRLKERGTRFKQLIDDTRRRFAINYLKDNGNTLTHVAFLLGYSEVSAFNHAFRRWVGQSPGDYRRRRAAVAKSVAVKKPEPLAGDSSKPI